MKLRNGVIAALCWLTCEACAGAGEMQGSSVDELLSDTNRAAAVAALSADERASLQRELHEFISADRKRFTYLQGPSRREERALALLIDLGDQDAATSAADGLLNAKRLDDGAAFRQSNAMFEVLRKCTQPAVIPLLADGLFADEPSDLVHARFNFELATPSRSTATALIIGRIVSESPVFAEGVRRWAKTSASVPSLREWWKENKAAFEQEAYGSVQPGVSSPAQ